MTDDQWEENISRLVGMKAGWTDEQRLAYLVARRSYQQWHKYAPVQTTNWLEVLATTVEKLLGARTLENSSLFWIRLAGVTEIEEEVTGRTEIDIKITEADASERPGLRPYVEMQNAELAFSGALKSFVTAFSDLEWGVIDYERNCQVHPFPRALVQHIKLKKKNLADLKIQSNYKGLDKAALTAFIDKEIRRVGAREAVLAAEYATRINSQLPDLIAFGQRWRKASTSA